MLEQSSIATSDQETQGLETLALESWDLSNDEDDDLDEQDQGEDEHWEWEEGDDGFHG